MWWWGWTTSSTGQWRNVWPTMTDFVLLTDKLRARVSPDRLMAAVMVTWTSTGYDSDGTPFDRPGRCSFVLVRDSLDGPWRACKATSR